MDMTAVLVDRGIPKFRHAVSIRNETTWIDRDKMSRKLDARSLANREGEMVSSAESPSGANNGPATSPPARPIWVKVFGIILALIVVVVVVKALAGEEHGPGRHLPGGDSESHTPPVQHDS